MTKLTGTAKQIAYAIDIINNTIARVDAVIAGATKKAETREARIRAKMPEYTETENREIIAAWTECREWMATITDRATSAAEIIVAEKEYGWFNMINDDVCQQCGHSHVF